MARHSKKFAELELQRALGGDPDAIEYVLSHPAMFEHAWSALGNPARLALESIIARSAGPNKIVAEAARREIANMQAQLLSADADVYERMAVETVVVLWANMHHLIRQGNTSPVPPHLIKAQREACRSYDDAQRSLALLKQKLSDKPARAACQLVSPARR